MSWGWTTRCCIRRWGLGFDRIQGQEQRFIVCRAMNACAADL